MIRFVPPERSGMGTTPLVPTKLTKSSTKHGHIHSVPLSNLSLVRGRRDPEIPSEVYRVYSVPCTRMTLAPPTDFTTCDRSFDYFQYG